MRRDPIYAKVRDREGAITSTPAGVRSQKVSL